MGIKRNDVYLVWVHDDPETIWVERIYLDKKKALEFAKELAARDNLIERESRGLVIRYSDERWYQWVIVEEFSVSK